MDHSKLKYIYKRVHHAGFKIAIEVLNIMQTAGTSVNYTMAANHFFIELSQLPEYLTNNRNISALSIGGN